LGVFKPGALHPVTSAPIKALPCLCFFRLWRKNPGHPPCGWSVTQAVQVVAESSELHQIPELLGLLHLSFIQGEDRFFMGFLKSLHLGFINLRR